MSSIVEFPLLKLTYRLQAMGIATDDGARRATAGPIEEHRQPQRSLFCVDRLLLLLRPEDHWRVEGALDVWRLEGPCQLVATRWTAPVLAHLQYGTVLSDAAVRGVRNDAWRIPGPHEQGGEVGHMDLYGGVHSSRVLWLRGLLHTGILR